MIGDAVLAIQTLHRYIFQMESSVRKFAMEVAGNIQNYGMLPVFTVRRMAQALKEGSLAEGFGEIKDVAEVGHPPIAVPT